VRPNLLTEMKRRKVVRVAVVYLATAFAILQAADIMLPRLGVPEWAMSLVVVLVVLGFPLALVLAWALEITPDGGIRRTEAEEAAPAPGEAPALLGRRTVLVAGALLVLGIGLGAGWFLKPGIHAGGVVDGVASGIVEAEGETSPRSIAVLAFTDMSAARDQEYLSDGIAEELLNLLAQLPELRVISRSSAFSFKGQNLEIPEIAERLGVAHVLEGSVRKSGDRVRITAQLIEARTDTHLWSATYDRTLDDIFAIQDEIAATVVEQLKVTLLGALPRAREADPEAYALYLQARALRLQGTAEGSEQAFALLQEALDRDPGMVAAWTLLSRVHSAQAYLGSRAERFTLAREAIEKALALDPECAEAHAQLGWIAMVYDGNLAQAARHYEQAQELAPTALHGEALLGDLGRHKEAIPIREYVVARDPLNPFLHMNLGSTYYADQRPDAALASYRRARELAPDMDGVHLAMGQALLALGHGEAALTEVQKEPLEVLRLIGLVLVYHALGRPTESDEALAGLIDRYAGEWAIEIAGVLAYRGEAGDAFAWLERAVANQEDIGWIIGGQHFTRIHDDPRWLPFLRGIGRAPEQLDAISFEVRLPR